MPDRRDGGDPRGPARDRGQLLLVAGFALAVVLVSLVVVTNAAILAENLATREEGVDEHDVLSYRAAVVDGAGGVIDRENAAEYGSHGAVRANVSDGLTDLDGLLRETAARHAASARANVSAATLVNGSLVRLNGSTDDPDPFTNAGGDPSAPNWTVATDVEGVRGFTAVVTESSLADASAGDLDGAFHVVVRNSTAGTEWHAYVYDDDGITVLVQPSGIECSTPDTITNATVDFTEGTLAGVDCDGLSFGGAVAEAGPYDLLFHNGDAAAGGYDLTVRTEGPGAVSTGNVSAAPAADVPYSVPAVYAVEIPIRYQTSELDYRATVRVAPGEADA